MDDACRARMLRTLVEEHYALVYRYSYRLSGSASDADDLVQQTYLVAQSKLDQLRDLEHARGWLCAIARNTYLKGLRKHRSGGAAVSLESVPEPVQDGDALDDVDGEALQAALSELPDEYRVPLVLFYFEELSYKQIAEELDVPLGTVMSRLSRGKAHLRGHLAEPESEPASAHT